MDFPLKMPYLCGKQRFPKHLFWSKIAKKGPHSNWKKPTIFHVAGLKVHNAVEKCMEQWLEISKTSINISAIEHCKYCDEIKTKTSCIVIHTGTQQIRIVLNFGIFQG